MILAIDIGNTDLVFGVWKIDKWIENWRIPIVKDRQAELFYQIRISDFMLEAKIQPDQIQHIILSSVVPDLNQILADSIYNICHKEMYILGYDTYEKLPIHVPRPHEIGTDLVANSFGAWKLYQSNAIIVDFGTALTYTAIRDTGEILGVSIAPGIKTAISALSDHTAQLPVVPLKVPHSALGKDTVHAIQAGILCGYTGMVQYMIDILQKELGSDFMVIGTGGLSSILQPLQDRFDIINKNLTLDGLRLIVDELNFN